MSRDSNVTGRINLKGKFHKIPLLSIQVTRVKRNHHNIQATRSIIVATKLCQIPIYVVPPTSHYDIQDNRSIIIATKLRIDPNYGVFHIPKVILCDIFPSEPASSFPMPPKLSSVSKESFKYLSPLCYAESSDMTSPAAKCGIEVSADSLAQYHMKQEDANSDSDILCRQIFCNQLPPVSINQLRAADKTCLKFHPQYYEKIQVK